MPGAKIDPVRLNLAHRERQVLAKCMGLLARLQGKAAADCPFEPGTQHSAHWGIGFTAPDTTRGPV